MTLRLPKSSGFALQHAVTDKSVVLCGRYTIGREIETLALPIDMVSEERWLIFSVN